MPKSIIDVEVNDEAFKRYLELYQKYRDGLKKTTEDWKASAQVTDEAANSVSGMAEAFAAGSIAASAIADALSRVEGSAARSTSSFATAARHTKSIASDVAGVALSIAKFATFTIGGGLLGLGSGLFGLAALANAVSNQRKSAQGLGVTTAEQQAFGVNFGTRLVGSDFLNQIQSNQANISNQWAFQALGLQGEAYKDPVHAGIDVIQAANQAWRSEGNLTPYQRMNTGQGLAMQALGIDYATWQRIGQMTPDQLKQYESQYNKDVGTMGASDKTQQDWQNFSIELRRVKDQMESIFVKGLDPLVPNLTKLSTAIEAALAGFLASPNLPQIIKDLTTGIGELGKYLSSPQFISGLDNFATLIGRFAIGAGNVVSNIQNSLPPALGGNYVPTPPVFNASAPGLPSIFKKGLDWSAPWKPGYGMDFTSIGKKYGLTADELKAIGMQESGLNISTPDSKSGAQGLFQLMPGTAQQYGVTDPHDPNQSANAAGAYLRDLLKKYQGNFAEALAAYNWGPGNLDKDISKNGASWLQHAPYETQNYVKQIGGRMGLTVTVMNQTGSQVAIIGNAVRN